MKRQSKSGIRIIRHMMPDPKPATEPSLGGVLIDGEWWWDRDDLKPWMNRVDIRPNLEDIKDFGSDE